MKTKCLLPVIKLTSPTAKSQRFQDWSSACLFVPHNICFNGWSRASYATKAQRQLLCWRVYNSADHPSSFHSMKPQPATTAAHAVNRCTTCSLPWMPLPPVIARLVLLTVWCSSSACAPAATAAAAQAPAQQAVNLQNPLCFSVCTMPWDSPQNQSNRWHTLGHARAGTVTGVRVKGSCQL